MAENGDLIVSVDEAPGYLQDWWLETLVRMANDDAFSVSVTLFVRGTLVTGELVGARECFKQSAEVVARAAKDPSQADGLRSGLSKPAESLDGLP